MDGGADFSNREIEELRRKVSALEAELAMSREQPAHRDPDELIATPAMDAKLRLQSLTALRLTEATQLLRMVHALVGVGTWRWDEHNSVVQCSDGIWRLLDLDPEQPFRPEDVLERIHPDDRAKIRFDGQPRPRGCFAQALALRVLRRDGTVRNVLSTLAPLEDEQGEPSGTWVGLVVDVTERHTMEEELKNAQKMEALGRLAGGVAHDFNNYLTVALGNAELLQASISNERDIALLGEIIGASQRCQVLTQRLLEFGRKQLVRPPVISASDVVAQSDALIRRMLPEDVTLRAELPLEPVRLRIDAGKLEQAIMNLVLNARDAMKTGGDILLRVRCGERPSPNRTRGRVRVVGPDEWICVSVEDQGIGMDAETRARVFEPFFTTKPAGRGTGLGLSIVYGIVAQAGGLMEVRSTPGSGSCFEMWFPVPEDSASARAGRTRS